MLLYPVKIVQLTYIYYKISLNVIMLMISWKKPYYKVSSLYTSMNSEKKFNIYVYVMFNYVYHKYTELYQKCSSLLCIKIVTNSLERPQKNLPFFYLNGCKKINNSSS